MIGFALVIFFAMSLIPINSLADPDPYVTIDKVAVEEICNNFSVNLSVIGGAPPVKPIDAVIVIDNSGSMGNGGPGTSLEYARQAARDFVNETLPSDDYQGNKIALVYYATTATRAPLGGSFWTGTRATILTAINAIPSTTSQQQSVRFTNIHDGFMKAGENINLLGSPTCD